MDDHDCVGKSMVHRIAALAARPVVAGLALRARAADQPTYDPSAASVSATPGYP
jgi:hypothetical protein